MPDAQEIYRSAVTRLPVEERLRLAALILMELAPPPRDGTEKVLSVVEFINSLPAGRGCKTPAEADEYLRGERESWGH